MQQFFLLVLAGGLGSGFRYLTSAGMLKLLGPAWPWGTFVANAVGCLLIGLINTLALEAQWISKEAGLLLTTGFLGGLTTFSSFGFETFHMLERRATLTASVYVLTTVAVGLGCVWLGARLARQLSGG